MITLGEIENISFRRSGLSGYKTDDVDNFVDSVIEKVRDLELANKELELRIEQLNMKLQKHEENAASVQDAIITAEIAAKRLVREATEKAEKTESEANAKAEATVSAAEEKAEEIMRDAQLRSETILNSALVKSAENIDENNRIIERQKQHIIQIQSEVTRFREALLDSYKSHLKVINSLPRADEFKQYQTKLEESYPPEKPATPESVGSELKDEAERAVEAAKNDQREIRVEKVDEEKIKEISDDIRFNTKGLAAIKEDEMKAEAEKKAEEEKAVKEKAEEAEVIDEKKAAADSVQELLDSIDSEQTELTDLDAVVTEAEPESEDKEEAAVQDETPADKKPVVPETARSSYAIVHGKKKGKKGKKGKGTVKKTENADSNAKDIEEASDSGKQSVPDDEPKPMSIDELDDGVIFNSGKDEGTRNSREPIRISGDVKTKGFDFTDIE